MSAGKGSAGKGSAGEALAAAAEALVGAPFRLHGRDPATGLDCIGVLASALAALGRPAPLPNGYRMRTRFLPELAGIARACGFATACGSPRAGDVLILRMGPCQFHLAIAGSREGFVHAHAGINRVTLFDGPLEWPVAGHWRLTEPC